MAVAGSILAFVEEKENTSARAAEKQLIWGVLDIASTGAFPRNLVGEA
jgi:hypothetical protein